MSRLLSTLRIVAATLLTGIIFISSVATSASVSAPDSLISIKAKSTKIVYLDSKPYSAEQKNADADSIHQVVSTFYYDQFRHFQDPEAPYFMFLSKERGLAMGIGGNVRMRAYYDWNGAMPTSAFAPYTIPIPSNPLSKRHFATTPSGTGLFFRVLGYNKTIGNYQLYIETDFTGYDGRDLKLKKAYASVRDFTVGYATSTFSDPAAQPPVIDAAGNNNKFTETSVLVRYMPCFRRHWYLGVSVETPSTAVDAGTGDAKAVSEWLPDFAALVQYEWARGQHVRLSGIVRSLSYREMTAGKDHNLARWGLNLSSVTHPAYSWTTYVNATIGRGIAGLGGDMRYGHYDLIPIPSDPTRLYSPLTWGWSLGLQYNFRPNLFVSLSASQMHLNTKKGSSGDEYRWGTFACANVFWNILPRLSVAAEYDWGFRRNVSGAGKSACRANIMCAFSF